MSSRPEIKVPPSLRWREFRMRFVPILVFVCVGCLAVQLWRETVFGPNTIGAVETVQTAVIAPDAGFVTNLLVKPLQLVKAGDPVAIVVVTDSKSLGMQLDDLRTTVTLSKMEINSILAQERTAFSYESLSMNMMRFQADLATAKAELPVLEDTLKRWEQGWKEKVVAFNDYQTAKIQRDAAKAKIEELQKLVDQAQLKLSEAAHTAGAFTNFPGGANFQEVVKRLTGEQAKAIGKMNAPLILRAPIDGTVGTIFRRQGENVLAGDTILTVNALQGERIIAFVRQGSNFTPRKGMEVKVHCRTQKREQAIAKIEEVGQSWESITNHALMRPGVPFELGVPVGITMPPQLKSILRPGEVVDLAIQP